MNAPLIYLIAGEASGDALGAGLMQALRKENPNARFAGIGGEAMERAGLKSLFPYNELSIMGFLEVVPHMLSLLARLRQTALDIAEKHPAAVITIDSPGFNFRLAQSLKNAPQTAGIKRIHYVAPSVWAYKPQRAKKTAELFNALLTLLPFEPPYFEKEGLHTVFVGHPVLWEEKKGDGKAFRARHNIAPDKPLLLVLPGSRKGEVKRLLPLFLEAAASFPNYQMAIMASPQVKKLIEPMSPEGTLIVDVEEKQDAFAASNLALSKSGTITLELAVAGVPMVVAYKTSAISAWLIRRMILIRYASLVNIAVDKEIVPELIQEQCNVPKIVETLRKLTAPEAQAHQKAECAGALTILRGGNTTDPQTVAARAVMACITS